jgi:hypothetical protein
MNEVLLRYTYQEMRYFMEEPALTISERTEKYLSLIHVLNHLMPKEGASNGIRQENRPAYEPRSGETGGRLELTGTHTNTF